MNTFKDLQVGQCFRFGRTYDSVYRKTGQFTYTYGDLAFGEKPKRSCPKANPDDEVRPIPLKRKR